MKYNHTNRISLSCYEYAFRTWPLYEWSVKVLTTHSAVEISRKPHPLPPTPQAIRIWGLYLSFIGGVAFPLHHGSYFALKGSAPSRVFHLAGA